MSYLGHSLVEVYPTAEIQSVYSTAPANWVERMRKMDYLTCFLSDRGKSNILKIRPSQSGQYRPLVVNEMLAMWIKQSGTQKKEFTRLHL